MTISHRIRYVDSHTGGEPTRVILDGFPNLGSGTLQDRAHQLRTTQDRFRALACTEPRASDVMVGALLLPPVESESIASVIFFNNVSTLGMCGHGTIGVIETLRHLGKIVPGVHRLDTPVGTVTCELRASGAVSIDNVLSYRHAANVKLHVDGIGNVVGDVAWGGNWFFLVDTESLTNKLAITRANLGTLTRVAGAIRAALRDENITGQDGAEIDHIELFGASLHANHDSRNFVLCPGMEYDRSPCGTGTSAKLACLAAAGKLAEGELWRQESVIGSVFEGRYRTVPGGIIPTITGRAFVMGEGELMVDDADPFAWGIGAST